VRLTLIFFFVTVAAAQEPAPPPAQPESSSRDTLIDLSPPRGDRRNPEVEPAAEPSADVSEMKPWNPHRAMKHVEVGQFHMKRGNYRAAEDRFREALQYKPRDAVATFRLAQALEKRGKLDEARKNYEEYLKILPSGKFAKDAENALKRLDKSAQKTSGAI
jgi:tetratricopeptide (TPR) repeat protein